MTVVIGYVAEGRVWMGADSNSSEPGNGQVWERDQPKIWRTTLAGSTVLLGFAGSVGLEMACRVDLDITDAKGAGTNAWAQRVAHDISELAQSHRLMNKDGDEMAGTVLLARGARLWEITYRCAWPVPHIGAIGSGREIAWGALAVLDRINGRAGGGIPPERMVTEAVEVACDWNDGCRPPVFMEVTDAVPS